MDVYHKLQQKRKQQEQQQEQQQQKQQQEEQHDQKRRKSDSDQTQESPHMQTSDSAMDGEGSTQGGAINTSSSHHTYRNVGLAQPPLDTLDHIVNIAQATVPSVPLPSQSQEIPMPGPDLANIIFRSSVSTTAAAANEGAEVQTATSGSHGHHRKSTTSPPTPITATPSGANKGHNTKGPRSIHAIELIRIAGEILQFPPTTIGTALIYYHKYRAFLYQAHKRGDRDNEATKADEYASRDGYLFATACLHLASKCTEVSRKVRDLVNVTYRVMNPSQPVLSLSTKPEEDKANTAASTPSNSQSSQQQQHTYPTAPPPTVHTYWHIRDSLLTTELMLLRILQFDLDVPLPFSDVLRICKGMGSVFTPTDEESAQLYPAASNFDVFLPATLKHPGSSSSSSSPPNKHGTPSSSSSSSSAQPISSAAAAAAAPHTGIHPTLSAVVQISITFCIDALCSSNIALNSSSRALAMGAIYLAVRTVGLELPMPFQDWCYAWGGPNMAAGFGILTSSSGAIIGSVGSSGVGGGLVSPGLSGAGISSMNGILGLSSGTNNLFVINPRLTAAAATSTVAATATTTSNSGSGSNGGASSSDSTTIPNGFTGTAAATTAAAAAISGVNGMTGKDSAHGSQTHSPLQGSNDSPLATLASPNSSQDLQPSQSPQQQQQQQQPQPQSQPQPQQPLTIVDEVRKVVQELGSFYVH
ncbi:hypothetical protein BGX31_010642 [Mortierella sp. GBA43]|nr:hypothetical protein BGX31_010642 [Mortierella sp. GBA43]